ncbi:hypothetical protein [Vibrio phage BUCT194]|uniref:Uncharacterized protein n=1 Tax=Vibrio phage BUCT194 TaxID=2859072 RepID=A0AAE8XF47_9CAUD|nr:hypothetical protein PP741_gp056 [Vibrio phage BUCT194]UAW01169.1 hypothetical protein [Vibrio phage BUCT194]
MQLVPNFKENKRSDSWYFLYRTNIFTDYGRGLEVTQFDSRSWTTLLISRGFQLYEID